jgi:H+-transporting ATPase
MSGTNPLHETFRSLGSGAKGLGRKEAAKRLERYGYNEIAEKGKNRFAKFAVYFWGPLSWMIEVAALLSAILQHWDDLAIILSLLVVNAVVGFWQENKADNAIALLRKRLALTARVLRDGNWVTLPSRELVPGDVIRIRLGDIIPADIRLIDGEYLLLDESALTGESLPVEKHVPDATFSSAIVKQGEMTAIVTSTGRNTYFGKTTKLVQEAKAGSHLQKAVTQIGDYLIKVAIAIVIVVLVVAALRSQNFLDSLQFALVLLIASIPVAMPAVLSVTMAVGAEALAAKDAIVTKLETIEEAAGMDVLCVDKTGTITKNEISVAAIKSFGGFSEEEVVLFAGIASRREDNDPLEAAIFAEIDGRKMSDMLGRYRVTKYTPFDPVSKRTEAAGLNTKEKASMIAIKGAPQVVRSLVVSGSRDLAGMDRAVAAFATKGYRTIAVAEGASRTRLKLVGLIALYDPPREDSKKTIAAARAMGIDVKMVTGDHIAIAREMCREVGIGDRVVPARTLQAGSGHDLVERTDAFAEVFPEQKYDIVDMLQKRGHIVGMTGDGVNDSPALKQAEVGIAVSGATDAARAAADIVLTMPGLSVIIEAVAQSRKIFERMNSYAVYRIAETIRVLLLISLAIIFFNFYPLTVLMLVLLALLNDIPIMMIAYDNARVQDGPLRWNMKEVLNLSTFLGGMGVVSSFLLLGMGVYVFHLDAQTLQALMFLKLAVAGHMTIYLSRTGKDHFWKRPLPAGRMFFTIEITQIIATGFVASGILLAPLSWTLILLVWGYALAFFVLNDFAKVAFMKRMDYV